MELMDVIERRHAVRRYDHRPVGRDVLEQVFEAGRLAPTGANFQPVRVRALASEQAVERIRAITPCAFDAPVVLLFSYDRDVEWKNPITPGATCGPQDASIVGTHMMLRATELGLGTCWVDHFDADAVHDAFGLPENETLLFIMPIGYPAQGDRPNARHAQRIPLDELVTWL